MFWHAPEEARMPVGNIYPGCINGDSCNPGRKPRPIYLHGHCWTCWASMPSDERRLLIWEDEQDVEPTEDWEVDDLLRMLATMATFDGDRHFKDAA